MLKVSVSHEQEYGIRPAAIAKVNGCIHLLGDHTGFAGGKALSIVTGYPMYAAVSKRTDTAVRFFYTGCNERKRSSLQSMKYKKEDRWANNIKAVIASFMSAGVAFTGMNITVDCRIPSSAMGITETMTLAAAFALRFLFAPGMSDMKFISLVTGARVSFLGCNAAVATVLNSLYSAPGSAGITGYYANTFTPVPVQLDGYSIVATESKIPGAAISDELGMRIRTIGKNFTAMKQSLNCRDICACPSDAIEDFIDTYPETVRRQMRCVVQEIARVDEAAACLAKKDTTGFLRILNRSHESLRDLYEISFPEIDWLVKRIQEFGRPAAARIITNGNSGCIYGIMPDESLDGYKAKLDEYERIFGFHPAVYRVESGGKAKIYTGDEINENISDE